MASKWRRLAVQAALLLEDGLRLTADGQLPGDAAALRGTGVAATCATRWLRMAWRDVRRVDQGEEGVRRRFTRTGHGAAEAGA